jgi:hypothetical protein
MLDGLKKERLSKHTTPEIVTEFKAFWEGGGGNV